MDSSQDTQHSASVLKWPYIFNPDIAMNTHKCHNCGEAGTNAGDSRSKTLLRKCAGCSVALYCSKQCQKTAWPAHKLYCRRPDPCHGQPDNADDHSSDVVNVPIVGAENLRRFHSMHNWAIRIMCQIIVHLQHNGSGAEAFRREPIIMRIEVEHVPCQRGSPWRTGKPWNCFALKNVSWRTVEDCERTGCKTAQMWKATQETEQYKENIANDRAEYGDRYIGALPIIFYMNNSEVSLLLMLPMLALRHPDVLQGEAERGALKDLKALCMGYTNAGIPLQLFAKDAHYALPAKIVKEQKEWRWLPLGTPERPFDDLYLHIFEKAGRKSELDPIQLMLFYASL
ncbi:hypothetical protein C8Q80DRAFT_1265807 [Daedaleopsis nitida]|nr:hypothetical protein C8Q80DRAFT_1265807 [Daedaleopsis nitida]